MEAFCHEQEEELEQTMDVRREWEQATEQTRRLALSADSELRRRHPEQHLEPLRSAEPTVSQDEHDQLVLTPLDATRPRRHPPATQARDPARRSRAGTSGRDRSRTLAHPDCHTTRSIMEHHEPRTG